MNQQLQVIPIRHGETQSSMELLMRKTPPHSAKAERCFELAKSLYG